MQLQFKNISVIYNWYRWDMENTRVKVDGIEYEIIRLIAKGKGGYTYIAKNDDISVIVKQIHHEPCDYFQFEDDKLSSELRDYNTLRSLAIPTPELLSFDQEKQLLIKEYIDGDNLAKIVACNKLSDNYIIQIFDMCKCLYPNGLNIDYFPTNFVERHGKLYYVDYECSRYSDEWNFENWGIWFLANSTGFSLFLQNGNHAELIKNGKPIRKGYEECVEKWLRLK